MSISRLLFPNAPLKYEIQTLADLGRKENLTLPLSYIYPRSPEAADFFVRLIKKNNPVI